MTLGQKLKQTRLARGMTQSQVVGPHHAQYALADRK